MLGIPARQVTGFRLLEVRRQDRIQKREGEIPFPVQLESRRYQLSGGIVLRPVAYRTNVDVQIVQNVVKVLHLDRIGHIIPDDEGEVAETLVHHEVDSKKVGNAAVRGCYTFLQLPGSGFESHEGTKIRNLFDVD